MNHIHSHAESAAAPFLPTFQKDRSIIKTTLVVLGLWALTTIVTSPSLSGQSAQPIARPKTPVPHFRVAHEDFRNPISLVIAPNATDEQVVSLLWKIRDAVRSHSFSELGLQPANGKNRYNTSGMIEVFRGTRCVAETYTEGVWPCGDTEHYDGFYQWGLGGLPLDAEARFARDTGGYRRRDGTMVIILTDHDGYTPH